MKGHLFKPSDIPERRREKMTNEQITAWCVEQTKRHAIVAVDPDERADRQAIIREELAQRALNKLSPKARRIAGTLYKNPVKLRAEVLAAFTETGELKNPFPKG